MQPSKTTLAEAVLVLLAGGWMMWLLMRQPDSPALSPAPPDPRQAAATLALARKPAPLPVFGSLEFKKMLIKVSASWLEARHRDAPGLQALRFRSGLLAGQEPMSGGSRCGWFHFSSILHLEGWIRLRDPGTQQEILPEKIRGNCPRPGAASSLAAAPAGARLRT